MAEPFRPFSLDGNYDDAADSARAALQAHRRTDYPGFGLAAAAALEHLARACLISRSPALIASMKDGSAETAAWLLGVDGAKLPRKVRTIGPFEALDRIHRLVQPTMPVDLLHLLIFAFGFDVIPETTPTSADLHAAVTVAFVQYAELLLADLGRDRAEFWGSERAVADALLADGPGKLARTVAAKLQDARTSSYPAWTPAKWPEYWVDIAQAAYSMAGFPVVKTDVHCPACNAVGTGLGEYDVEHVLSGWNEKNRRASTAEGAAWFIVNYFYCTECGLDLVSPAEVAEAGLDVRQPADSAAWRVYAAREDEDDQILGRDDEDDEDAE